MKIKNVKVVNFDGIIENADVEINGNKIAKITPIAGESKKILIPGFIDQHIHGFTGHDAMDGTEAIEFMSSNLPAYGTTSFLPTVMTSKLLEESLVNAAKAKSAGSRILGLHAEGPYLSIKKKGAHDENFIIKATSEHIKKLIKLSNNSIRKMTIAPENFDISLLPLLFENNIIASIGHTNFKGKEASEYFKAGASSVTHLWNAMTGVENRNPGLAEEALTNDSITAEMILDFVHVDQATAKLSIEAKGIESVTLVTDSVRPAGLPDGHSCSGGLSIEKKGNLITLEGTNTIAGSGATMLDNFKNILTLGYDFESAVAMTSYNAAILLGEDQLGLIKEGATADLVILDANMNIEKVMIDGEWKYDKNN